MIILEVGINHFGSIKEANDYLKFFFKSDFKYLTFQIQTKKFYQKNKKINFELPISFYKKALDKAQQHNKKIGLAVCCARSFKKYENLSFNFYKLLSIAINNFQLIDTLSKFKKKIFISLGKGTNKNILKCLNRFSKKNNLNLIYTSMSYSPKDLNLSRINILKKIFRLPVGYGHHYKNNIPLYFLKIFKADYLFIYIKKKEKRGRIYPDDTHAIEIDKLNNLKDKLNEIDIILANKKINTKIKLNEKKISF